MKKLIILLSSYLFLSFGIGSYANATEQSLVAPSYLKRNASTQVANKLAVKLSDEINDNIGRVGFDLLRSVNTRDGLIVLLRYFAENCQECIIAKKMTKDVLPTNVTNYFLSSKRAVNPTLDSRLTLTSDDNQTSWEWFPDTTIKPADLSCLNCIGGHCP